MTKAELLEILRNGENSGVDFKRDAVENHKLAKDLVAFANLSGGMVLLGVDDDGSVSGITRDKLEEWVMTASRDKIRPELIPYLQIIREAARGKDVAVVRVERGYTVHHLWHNHHRTYYIRVGSESREASPEELARLFQQRGALRMEVSPLSGSSISDLDLRRLRDYFERVRQQSAPPIEDPEQWRTLLVNTEIMTEANGHAAATVAGMLLFGKRPNRFLPQAGIDAAAHLGREKDYEARERAQLRGPMTPLFSGDGQLVENGLIEQAVAFVRRNTKVESRLADGARRIDRWTYPEEAVRETLVNALVHRDYLLSGTDVELSLYEDRLEVISPGRLPNGITPERMKIGCRSSRNQLLKDVMGDYGYLEHMGMGIPRKIIKCMKQHNGTEPDLIEQEEAFMVRLRS